MNHLLIWEEVPENTKAYVLVPGRDDVLIEYAKHAHGHFINRNENEATERLNELMYDANTGEPLIACAYDINNANEQQIPDGPFAAVYITGFIL